LVDPAVIGDAQLAVIAVFLQHGETLSVKSYRVQTTILAFGESLARGRGTARRAPTTRRYMPGNWYVSVKSHKLVPALSLGI